MSYGASNQTSGPVMGARSSTHDPVIVGDGRSFSRCTTCQVRPPSVVLAMPLNRCPGPAPICRPSNPTYAMAGSLADAVTTRNAGGSPEPAPVIVAFKPAADGVQVAPSSRETNSPFAKCVPLQVVAFSA